MFQSQKLDEDMSLPAALRHVVDFGCHKYQTPPITGNKDGSTKISTDILVKFMSNLTAQTLKPADVTLPMEPVSKQILVVAPLGHLIFTSRLCRHELQIIEPTFGFG